MTVSAREGFQADVVTGLIWQRPCSVLLQADTNGRWLRAHERQLQQGDADRPNTINKTSVPWKSAVSVRMRTVFFFFLLLPHMTSLSYFCCSGMFYLDLFETFLGFFWPSSQCVFVISNVWRACFFKKKDVSLNLEGLKKTDHTRAREERASNCQRRAIITTSHSSRPSQNKKLIPLFLMSPTTSGTIFSLDTTPPNLMLTFDYILAFTGVVSVNSKLWVNWL